MAGTFRTNKEAKKWDYLEALGKQSLDKIRNGSANKSDLMRLSSILDKYDALAKSIFDNATGAIDDVAQGVVDRINEDREKKGKPCLSEDAAAKLFDLALKRALDDFGPDLVETIESIFSKQLDEQDELTGYRIDDAVEKIQAAIPPPNEPCEKDSPEEWDKRLDTFAEKANTLMRKSVVEMAAELRKQLAPEGEGGTAKSSSRWGSMFGRMGSGGKSIIDKMRASLSSGVKHAKSRASQMLSSTRAFLGNFKLNTSQNQNDPNSAAAQQQKKQNSIFDSINSNLKKFIKSSRDYGKIGVDRVKKTFESAMKKFNSMRKFFTGGVKHLASKGIGGISGIASTLAKAALMGLVYSPLVKYLLDQVSQNFDGEAIMNKLGDWWDWAKQKAPEALAWVWDKVSNFDYKGVAEKIWNWIKEAMSWTGDKVKKGAENVVQAGKDAAKSVGGWISDKASSVANFFGFGDKKKDASGSGAGSGGSTGGSVSDSGPGGTTSGAMNSDSSGSKTTPTPALTGSANTILAPNSSMTNVTGATANYSPDFSSTTNATSKYGFTAPGASNTRTVAGQAVRFSMPPTTSGGATNGSAKGDGAGVPDANKGGKANVMGLGSFGLTAGVNDTLGLMNLGVMM